MVIHISYVISIFAESLCFIHISYVIISAGLLLIRNERAPARAPARANVRSFVRWCGRSFVPLNSMEITKRCFVPVTSETFFQLFCSRYQ